MSIRRIAIIVSVVLALSFLFGCAGRTFTPEQKAYGRRAIAQPTTFTLPAQQAETAWARAHQFISHYSSMKIQMATEHTIQTYNPVGDWPKYGYTVSKVPVSSNVQFSVQCFCSNPFSNDNAQLNAHLLAHYMVSGELNTSMVAR